MIEFSNKKTIKNINWVSNWCQKKYVGICWLAAELGLASGWVGRWMDGWMEGRMGVKKLFFNKTDFLQFSSLGQKINRKKTFKIKTSLVFRSSLYLTHNDYSNNG
jgi:hypothetical protein